MIFPSLKDFTAELVFVLAERACYSEISSGGIISENLHNENFSWEEVFGPTNEKRVESIKEGEARVFKMSRRNLQISFHNPESSFGFASKDFEENS